MQTKKFGDMTPAEKQAAVRRAADQLQAELTANADAIGRVMDEAIGSECECLPGQVCDPCGGRGYRNGLAGYAARIYPDRVTQADMDEQDRADRELEV